jgi:16S rRNA processing protein RimM
MASARADSPPPEPRWDDLVLVGTIARPHGLRGEVVVNAATDFAEERFRQGASLRTQLSGRLEPLVVRSARMQNGRPIVAFDGFESVTDAGRLVGAELRVPESALVPLPEGAYYHHQLTGCTVETAEGARVGDVLRVDDGAGGALLVVGSANGEVLIPLAHDICVRIDVRNKRIEVAPPEGLIELNATKRR